MDVLTLADIISDGDYDTVESLVMDVYELGELDKLWLFIDDGVKTTLYEPEDVRNLNCDILTSLISTDGIFVTPNTEEDNVIVHITLL